MDELTSTALAGTSRRPAEAGTIPPAIGQGLSDLPAERRLLLGAGVRATVRMAAQKPERITADVEPCPPDARCPCSPRAARIVGNMLSGMHADLLPEALDLLRRAAQRLPHAMVVDALKVRDETIARAMREVIGTRGLWLARQNPAWASGGYAAQIGSLDEAERAWTEGTPAQRRQALRSARAIDPTRARGWLEQTWTKEKADQRASFLDMLSERLSPDDEPFLEAALSDRSGQVREAAQTMLAHLASSAFVKRMIARADDMLDFKRAGSSRTAKRDVLHVHPPENVDAAADRDGLLAKPPAGTGARGFWLLRALSAVPPSHWLERFEATAGELIAAVSRSEWAATVCEGWTNAVVIHGGAAWATPLWEFWQTCSAKLVSDVDASGKLLELFGSMPAEDVAKHIAALLQAPSKRLNLSSALAVLPAPWTPQIGMLFVAAMHLHLPAATRRAPEIVRCLPLAARALPLGCLAQALAPLDLSSPAAAAWEQPVAELAEILQLRQTLAQEITP